MHARTTARPFPLPLAIAAGLAAATAATAQTGPPFIILDDFDADNTDELLGPQGLLTITAGSNFPVLVQDETFVSFGDIGAVVYIDTDPVQELTVGQWPNDAGAGVELGLDFEALQIVGFEYEFRNVSEPVPFGVTIFDGGPSGSPERKVAAIDTLLPAGDSVFRTLFTDPDWIIEPGFEFTDIGSLYYGLNQNPRTIDGPQPIPTVALEFIEYRAIVAPPCSADLTGDETVDLADLLALLAVFGTDNANADINDNGAVDLPDLLNVLANFGKTCDEIQFGG